MTIIGDLTCEKCEPNEHVFAFSQRQPWVIVSAQFINKRGKARRPTLGQSWLKSVIEEFEKLITGSRIKGANGCCDKTHWHTIRGAVARGESRPWPSWAQKKDIAIVNQYLIDFISTRLPGCTCVESFQSSRPSRHIRISYQAYKT